MGGKPKLAKGNSCATGTLEMLHLTFEGRFTALYTN